MGFWGKIAGFFKGFFHNVVADPVSSLKGAAQLAAAGGICYGMANGTVPVDKLSVSTAAGLTAAGIHALGTNSATGKEPPAVAKVEAVVQAAPAAMSVVESYQQMAKEAAEAKQKLDQFTALSLTMSGAIQEAQQKVSLPA